MAKKALTDVLEDYGFNVISMPSPDIHPLELLFKQQGYLERFGELKDLFEEGETFGRPQVNYDIEAPNELQGKTSRKLDSNAGFSFLENLFQKLGIKGGGIHAAFGNAKTFNFKFENPTMDSISLAKLDQFVNDAKILSGAKSFVEKLKKDDVYVITAVLKCNSITIQSQGENQGEVEVSLPEIKNTIGAEASLKKNNAGEISIFYQGPNKLVFAVKAARLIYDKKGLFSSKPPEFRIKTVHGETVRDQDFPADWLKEDSNLIPLITI